MIFRIRMFPKEDADPIWGFVNEKFASIESEKVRPLFTSIQTGSRFVSAFVMVDDVESIGDFLVEEIGKRADIVDTTTIPLLKMTFLPVREGEMGEVKRYSIMMKCLPRYYYSLYKKLINLTPEGGVYPNFGAFTLGEDDMFLSVWAGSKEQVEKFVEDKIMVMEGMETAEVFPIDKTKIFMSGDDWKQFQRAFLHIPNWVTDDMRDSLAYSFFPTEEDIGLSGGMTDES